MSAREPTPPPVAYRVLCPTAPEGPLELQSLFPQGAEIEVEIGFGRGMFLIQRAQAARSSHLLGLEIKSKWAYRVDERCKRLGLGHVKVLQCDVRELLPRIAPGGQIARAFLHFPDPWWKKRHAKRRLVGDDLLDELARLLRPGGEFFMQSDVEERAELHAERLDAHAAFELVGPGGRLAENPYGAVSNREHRAQQDGLPIYRVLARAL